MTPAEAGTHLSSAQQEALKAQIKELLKNMSTELQALEAQLAAQQKDLSSPTAGTSTDPALYEDAARLDPTTGNPLPIQLQVDRERASSSRQASGTGKPAAKASDASPQQVPEPATLSDQPTEEAGVRRQAIPPDYRPVFERLQPKRESPPSP